MRNTPILTFINKLDREGMNPLDILADIEETLQIECAPLSWPIGMGKRFRGTYNRYRNERNLFTPGEERLTDGVLTIYDLDDPMLVEQLGGQAEELRNDMALLEGASNPFVPQEYLKGSQTPVFSAARSTISACARCSTPSSKSLPHRCPGRRPPASVVARRGRVLRLRLQDPGEHGPGAPRPYRLPARLLGPFGGG